MGLMVADNRRQGDRFHLRSRSGRENARAGATRSASVFSSRRSSRSAVRSIVADNHRGVTPV
jgi:hypothetical protein